MNTTPRRKPETQTHPTRRGGFETNPRTQRRTRAGERALAGLSDGDERATHVSKTVIRALASRGTDAAR